MNETLKYMQSIINKEEDEDVQEEIQNSQGIMFLRSGDVIGIDSHFLLMRAIWMNYKLLISKEASKEEMNEFFDATTVGGVIFFGNITVDVKEITAMLLGSTNFEDEDED